MPYRVEVAKQGRAGCKGTACKKDNVKIGKGELRFGTQVTIQEHTTMTWKHWGCTTPFQIDNLKEESGGDTDLVDGYDDLPPEYQEKVDFALEHGHVPDEDWKGDIEMNRDGQKGMFKKVTKAKKPKKGEEAEDDGGEAEKPTKKKRSHPVKDESDDEAPAAKKAKSKSRKKADKEAETKEPAPKAKKPKAKKAKAEPESDAASEEAAEPPKAKRGRKKASADGEKAEKAAPQKKGRKKKASAEDE